MAITEIPIRCAAPETDTEALCTAALAETAIAAVPGWL